MLALGDIDTNHLFNIFKMLWNHLMPESYRSEKYRVYKFKAFYTPEYMSKAIRHVGAELLKRKDLSDEEKDMINKWRKWLIESNQLGESVNVCDLE